MRTQILNLVINHMKWSADRAEVWMRTDNPLLGGASPNLMVKKGRGHKVLRFVESAIDESTPEEHIAGPLECPKGHDLVANVENEIYCPKCRPAETAPRCKHGIHGEDCRDCYPSVPADVVSKVMCCPQCGERVTTKSGGGFECRKCRPAETTKKDCAFSNCQHPDHRPVKTASDK